MLRKKKEEEEKIRRENRAKSPYTPETVEPQGKKTKADGAVTLMFKAEGVAATAQRGQSTAEQSGWGPSTEPMHESAPDWGAVGVTDYIPFQAGSPKPAEKERGRSEYRGDGWKTQTQGGRWRSGSRAPSVARSEDYSRAGDPGLQYGEKTGSERPSSVGAQHRVPAEYSEEQLARDRVPLATGALQRKRDSRYWASLQAVSPADILSTSAALEPERYRETVEPIHPEHRIVCLDVMRTHPHRAMDA